MRTDRESLLGAPRVEHENEPKARRKTLVLAATALAALCAAGAGYGYFHETPAQRLAREHAQVECTQVYLKAAIADRDSQRYRAERNLFLYGDTFRDLNLKYGHKKLSEWSAADRKTYEDEQAKIAAAKSTYSESAAAYNDFATHYAHSCDRRSAWPKKERQPPPERLPLEPSG